MKVLSLHVFATTRDAVRKLPEFKHAPDSPAATKK